MGRDGIVAEFDQQIPGVADGVSVGVSDGVLNIFVGEMEIATQ